MAKKTSDETYSIGCAINSFVSTYISGILHPLDIIKTRFQSIITCKQVTMAKHSLKILFQGTKVLLMAFKEYTNMKALLGYIKDFIFQCSVRLQQLLYSFGCKGPST